MFNIELPIWLHGETVTQLKSFFQAWWQQVEEWLQVPLQELDPDTVTLGLLNLMAWGRNIKRLNSEPEALYRLRVKFAFVNARDAGNAAGFIRIFARLGIPLLGTNERVPDQDWDIIELELSDATLADNNELLGRLIRDYGRTCRRYVLQSGTHTIAHARAGEFNADYATVSAKLNEPDPLAIAHARAGDMNCDYLTIGVSI